MSGHDDCPTRWERRTHRWAKIDTLHPWAGPGRNGIIGWADTPSRIRHDAHHIAITIHPPTRHHRPTR